MEYREYLLETFAFNDAANRQMLKKIGGLKEQSEAIRYFSHLINSQLKWMARIKADPRSPEMDWWNPVYEYGQLEDKWAESLKLWIDYIKATSEAELLQEVEFIGFDGGLWAARPLDIALQLNYHSIHHRAQIQTLIRAQGETPDFIDYIGTKYRKIN
jgi:uncharacterized damage-inducible protein DinB